MLNYCIAIDNDKRIVLRSADINEPDIIPDQIILEPLTRYFVCVEQNGRCFVSDTYDGESIFCFGTFVTDNNGEVFNFKTNSYCALPRFEMNEKDKSILTEWLEFNDVRTTEELRSLLKFVQVILNKG